MLCFLGGFKTPTVTQKFPFSAKRTASTDWHFKSKNVNRNVNTGCVNTPWLVYMSVEILSPGRVAIRGEPETNYAV